jgi:hypothetical protein
VPERAFSSTPSDYIKRGSYEGSHAERESRPGGDRVLALPSTSIDGGRRSRLLPRKVSSYVAEVDQLLTKERNWITPFLDLNNRSFPFVDCDVDALLEVVWQSRFRRPITYNPRTKEYFIVFSSNGVRVGFAYGALEKKSRTPLLPAG